jgi:glycine cleavage system H protein
LSDVVFVDLPKLGRKVKAGETIAVVESVKAASDIYSPASGEVVEVNEALAQNAALVNTDPFGDGWMFKLKLDGDGGAAALMDAAGYKAQIGA